ERDRRREAQRQRQAAQRREARDRLLKKDHTLHKEAEDKYNRTHCGAKRCADGRAMPDGLIGEGEGTIETAILIVVTRGRGAAGRGALWAPRGAVKKIPEGWAGKANKKGIGTRWQDPKNSGNGVRIDKGNPKNPQPSQQQDHVVVRRNGKVIGRDGKPIKGSVKDDFDNAHIPYKEWKKWGKWYEP
ncbi:MAG TPA: hypothetical protein VGE95_11615, partial [Arthrobacter sp.]